LSQSVRTTTLIEGYPSSRASLPSPSITAASIASVTMVLRSLMKCFTPPSCHGVYASREISGYEEERNSPFKQAQMID